MTADIIFYIKTYVYFNNKNIDIKTALLTHFTNQSINKFFIYLL